MDSIIFQITDQINTQIHACGFNNNIEPYVRLDITTNYLNN